jgi:hypothetical protein
MNKDLLPHFLIVGAPKCGTTSLHYYISQHPDINTSMARDRRIAV